MIKAGSYSPPINTKEEPVAANDAGPGDEGGAQEACLQVGVLSRTISLRWLLKVSPHEEEIPIGCVCVCVCVCVCAWRQPTAGMGEIAVLTLDADKRCWLVGFVDA